MMTHTTDVFITLSFLLCSEAGVSSSGDDSQEGIHMEGGDEDYWNEWAKDVTGDGTTLNEFCRRTLVDALLFGHTAVVVDYPLLMGSTRCGMKQRLAVSRI